MSAMLAVRRVTTSAAVRVWAAVTYALLPVATGVIASGRFGSAVAFVLLPLIVAARPAGCVTESGRAGQPGRLGDRAARGDRLRAFVPLLWLVALIACVVAALVFRNTRRGLLRNLAIVGADRAGPAAAVDRSRCSRTRLELLLEAGLPQPGTPIVGLPAKILDAAQPRRAWPAAVLGHRRAWSPSRSPRCSPGAGAG